MKDIEILLIENHFKLTAKKEGCYIESLLPDSIEYLLNNSIKTYERNFAAYNFILELRNLYESELGTLKDGFLFLEYDKVINLSEEEKRTLCLPPQKSFDIAIHDNGVIGYKDFYFEYTITENGEELPLNYRGCFSALGSTKKYTLTKYQYKLFDVLNTI